MLKLTKAACSVNDRMEISSRQITAQGFLVAPAVIARTGVQTYRAGELGLVGDGITPSTLIRLYRPPEEVFAPDSMQSFDGVPAAMNHPPGNVIDAKNWRERAVGDMDHVAKADDTTLGGIITVRDGKAVAAVQSGKKFLSCGYRFQLDPTPGTTADGQEYDAVQRQIRGNHVAIVDMPRGGPVCRIADSTHSGGKAMRKFVVDGISIEIEDSTTADLFAKLQGDREAATLKLQGKLKIGDKEFAIGDGAALQIAIDGVVKENTDLKAKAVTPEQIEKQVSARVKLVGDALKLVPDFKADGKADVQIQREVINGVVAKDEASKKIVLAALDGVAVDAAEPSLLAIAFRLLSTSPKSTAGHQRTAADAALSTALVGKDSVVVDDKPVGRDAYVSRLENAWQGDKAAK